MHAWECREKQKTLASAVIYAAPLLAAGEFHRQLDLERKARQIHEDEMFRQGFEFNPEGRKAWEHKNQRRFHIPTKALRTILNIKY